MENNFFYLFNKKLNKYKKLFLIKMYNFSILHKYKKLFYKNV